ncbi:prolyl oligopeptidase family serine peptidase [Bradyrhizobium sp. CB2312]|uniref:prolyl oligopeptidase family serine peptidase n=1 Tax=Bradyrhizobium sp. CB2312 TaxID=3039155 RepID=UPI0024B0F821|nr:prolyl oligopeptidase family serine peptidase [Bradyrhizobium sp. CB2312]WFU77148.1 prolyl oligopeptidase family serine peptidase [Bradyrhizobium sp. CB2312]
MRGGGEFGGSQGGLLVGAAITQRPELFNAAIIEVPLFNMLRYTKLGAGAYWIGEYGDPDIAEQRA